MSAEEHVGKRWMVLLEAVDEHARSEIDAAAFWRMVSSWSAPTPTGLYSPCRYALQVSVVAGDAQAALATATRRWADAVRRAGLAEWQLVRAEAVRQDEFERELRAADSVREDGETLPFLSTPDPASDDLLRRALHDPVTGLPDRELFLDRVRGASVAAPPAAVQAVMVVHISGADGDGPSLEASTSEAVLVEVAGRLKDAVRRGDVVGRVGDDQFALLVTVPSGDDTDSVARRIVSELRPPVFHEGLAASLTATVGVARASDRADADDLIAMAEAALTAARLAGGGCYRQFAERSDSV